MDWELEQRSGAGVHENASVCEINFATFDTAAAFVVVCVRFPITERHGVALFLGRGQFAVWADGRALLLGRRFRLEGIITAH